MRWLFAAVFYFLATGQRVPEPGPTKTPVFMHSAAAASQSAGVALTVAERARPIRSLQLCAPPEHDVGWLWAQAAEEVDKINVEVRRPPNGALARVKPKAIRAFRICFPR
jgi:hypothetical protein